MPAPRFAYLDAPGPIAFAHRGADDAAENSLAAFEAVVELGYRYVETDVRATADGVLLAFHDATLDRVTNAVGTIARLPYEVVGKALVGGAEKIPLLEDLLGAFPELRVNIDVKEAAAIGPLIDAIRRTNAVERVCVAAFSDARVAAVRGALGPKLCTSLGPREIAALRLRSYAPGVRARGQAGCAQVPVRAGRLPVADARFVRAAHARGLQVHVWTVNDANEAERLLDLGVDGIMTDRAEMLRDVLQRRGQWHG